MYSITVPTSWSTERIVMRNYKKLEQYCGACGARSMKAAFRLEDDNQFKSLLLALAKLQLQIADIYNRLDKIEKIKYAAQKRNNIIYLSEFL